MEMKYSTTKDASMIYTTMRDAIRDPKELKVGMIVRKHHIHTFVTYTWEILSEPKLFRECTKETYYSKNLLNTLCMMVKNEYGVESLKFLSDCGVIPYLGKNGNYNEFNYLTIVKNKQTKDRRVIKNIEFELKNILGSSYGGPYLAFEDNNFVICQMFDAPVSYDVLAKGKTIEECIKDYVSKHINED